MDWLQISEEYIGRFGWGASGRMGICRMFTEQDKMTMCKDNVLASYRPRGILSGFLAVVPQLQYAVYIPPSASKSKPVRIRMRLSDAILKDGAIFSAYLTRDRRLIVEDVIVWGKQTVWTKHTFAERWTNYVGRFFQDFKPEQDLQGGITIQPAEYMSLQSLKEPSEYQLIEFIPNTTNTKRILWMPVKSVNTPDVSTTTYKAKKETSMGPDVFSLWKGEERLGIALVRTLEISRALRLANQEEIQVNAEWNKQFDKWEIKSMIK